MEKYIMIHIPHASLYLPREYQKKTLLTKEELDKENIFMCDYKVDELLESKENAIIFPYSRLYCDVERFKDETEIMNQYGMGYIYTKTSQGKVFFYPDEEHQKKVSMIYDNHHQQLDQTVTNILKIYQKCLIIDLHSYSSELVYRLFEYQNVPDICLGIEPLYYNEEITNHFISHFQKYGYTVKINYPYEGSLIPNQFYGKNVNIVSIMIEINKRVYEQNFEKFKEILNESFEIPEWKTKKLLKK